MPKSNPCPQCECKTVVVTHNAALNKAWPEWWRCGYKGSEKFKAHMIIHKVEENYLSKGADGKSEIMSFAVNLWNEVIGLEKLSAPERSHTSIEDEDYDWYDIATEDLYIDDETDNNKE